MSETSERLKKEREDASNLVKSTNGRIESLGSASCGLYGALTLIQQKFDAIRNLPDDKVIKYQEIKKVCLNWKSQVDRIEKDYQAALVAKVGKGAAGAGLGAGVAALGPTAAMGVATTFGVASTGTAISTLSGAAATNAALAWLGGGALAAGGGGMAAGQALLAMAGPVGWAIAAASFAVSIFAFWRSRSKKEKLENIYILIAKRDQTLYQTAIVELNERIERVGNETRLLYEAIDEIETFGTDYKSMTEDQHYKLGAYVNLMNSSSHLLVNPILGLQPKYTEADFTSFCTHIDNVSEKKKDDLKDPYFSLYYYFSSIKDSLHRSTYDYLSRMKNFYISMCNLLYNIKLDYDDRSLLCKSFRKNEDFLKQMGIDKSFLYEVDFRIVDMMLNYKYGNPS